MEIREKISFLIFSLSTNIQLRFHRVRLFYICCTIWSSL